MKQILFYSQPCQGIFSTSRVSDYKDHKRETMIMEMEMEQRRRQDRGGIQKEASAAVAIQRQEAMKAYLGRQSQRRETIERQRAVKRNGVRRKSQFVDHRRQSLQPILPSTMPRQRTKSTESTRRTNLGDRLYQQAKQLELKKKRLAEELASMNAPTFKPKLSQQSRKLWLKREKDYKLFDSEQQKRKMKERKQKQLVEELRECTFKPKINLSNRLKNRSSAATASRFQRSGKSQKPAMSVTERLYKSAASREATRAKLKRTLLADEQKELTFTPHINKAYRPRPSSRSPASSVTDVEEDSLEGQTEPCKEKSKVFDRLAKDTRGKREYLQAKKATSDMEGCTFKPNLSQTSSYFKKKHQRARVTSFQRDDSASSGLKGTSWEKASQGTVESESTKKDQAARIGKRASSASESSSHVARADLTLKNCTFDTKKSIELVRHLQKKKCTQKATRFKSNVQRLKKLPYLKPVDLALVQEGSGKFLAPLTSPEQTCFQKAFSMLTLATQRPSTKHIQNWVKQQEEHASTDGKRITTISSTRTVTEHRLVMPIDMKPSTQQEPTKDHVLEKQMHQLHRASEENVCPNIS